jgi:serine protease Do
MLPPGERVRLKVFRDGHERELTVTLGELPAQQNARHGIPSGKDSLDLGLTIEPATAAALRHLGLPPQTTGAIANE